MNHIYKYDVVSFDVFDTLIVRDVNQPHDVFSYMERELIEKYGSDFFGFREKRVTAERLALKKKNQVNLDEIYQMYEFQYARSYVDLKQLEIQYEENLTAGRTELLNLYLECVRRGKKIIIITDMYLPRETIENILSKNGVSDYAGLYISGEVGKSKRDGSLYQYVCEQEHIDKKKWIHVGDNFISDYLKARLFGIHAHRVHKVKNITESFTERPAKKKSIFCCGLASFVSNRTSAGYDAYRKIGYCLYGPFFHGVIKWIERNRKKDNIDLMLMMSRDGFLFQQAYRDVMSGRGIKYFLVSRKSLLRPFLATSPPYDMFFKVVIQSFPRSFSIQDFFNKLVIPINDEMKNFIYKYGYTLETAFTPTDLETDIKFQRMYTELLQILSVENLKAFNAFKTYLIQCGVKNGQKIGVFDMGWRGSIQFLLERILGCDIYGYYLFIDPSAFNLAHTRGFLAEDRHAVRLNSGYTSLLELVFSAPHGSVSGYTMVQGKTKVEFSAYEHGSDFEASKLQALREGALTCNKDLFNHRVYSSLFLASDEYAVFLKQAGENPTRSLVDLFDVFHFEDAQTLPLIGGGTRAQIFVHPKRFIYDFLHSSWKIGFLRKYGPFPLGSFFLTIKNKLASN